MYGTAEHFSPYFIDGEQAAFSYNYNPFNGKVVVRENSTDTPGLAREVTIQGEPHTPRLGVHVSNGVERLKNNEGTLVRVGQKTRAQVEELLQSAEE